jgi:hypothetical protein
MGETMTLPQKYTDPTRASIEAQVAIKSITDRVVAGIEVPDDLVRGCDWWCRHALQGYCADFHDMIKSEAKK